MVGHPRRHARAIRARALRANLPPVTKSVLAKHLTYLSPRFLRNIEWAIRQLDDVRGSFLETGVALGGSGIVMASHLGEHRSYDGYDVFGLIPPPGDQDPPVVHERYRVIVAGESPGIAGERYYGYQPDLYDRVCASFAEHGTPVDDQRVQLHRGLFAETLFPSGPVALAHIDCDWYEPVRLSLERIYPHLQRGAIVVSDDYYCYRGATTAVDEFLQAHGDLRPVERDPGHMILRRD
jgi:O-methyltransferase